MSLFNTKIMSLILYLSITSISVTVNGCEPSPVTKTERLSSATNLIAHVAGVAQPTGPQIV
ncbi:MAG: hypothetical protein RLZ75_2855 [Pseudomonadota bacterium]|jgi:hypothetical protein